MFAPQNQGRAAARGPATMRLRRRSTWLCQLIVLILAATAAGAVALPQAAGAAVATPGVTFTNLTLINGWSSYSSVSPAVAEIAGVVYFRGAIFFSGGPTNNVAFVLPAAFRPSRYVDVPVDMFSATGGELNIAPDGTTEVISSGANSNATTFTSLDGASFSRSTTSYTPLKLRPGWTEFDSFYRKAAVRVIGGIVHFEGEIKVHHNIPTAFTLPAKFRPSRNVNVLINICTGSIGRLHITPGGVVTVSSAEGFYYVKCGTSLDGATFALSSKSFTALKLRNGWKNAPSGTAKAAVRNVSGVVRFVGAIMTKGMKTEPFILPQKFRPSGPVYIPVDLCEGAKGRLDIQPDGVVTVQAASSFTQAQCQTSLDGAWFAR
jgi:hypothetical protein